MRSSFPVLASTFGALALAGCTTTTEAQPRDLAKVLPRNPSEAHRLPPPPPLPEPPPPPDLGPLLKQDDGILQRIRAGDVLSITIFDEPELSLPQARVTQRGTVTLPLLGEVVASQKTRAELQTEIRSRFEEQRYLKHADVKVEILFDVCRRVYVLGRIGTPGSFALPIDRRVSLLQLIALAGGLATAKVDLEADASAIRLTRVIDGAPRTFRISFEQIVEREQLEKNILLEPDDLIFVPPKKEMFIFGSVERPGGFPLADGSRLSVAEALALAGGFKGSAERDYITLIRRAQSGVEAYHVALDQTGRSAIMVTANDTLIATDRQTRRVYIIGQVAAAGSHPLDEAGMTVTKLIALAGGFKQGADTDDVRLIRVTPQGEQNIRVRVQTILDEGRLENDPELLPGDMIVVRTRVF